MKKGFTLAEVLITLGIVGVVAVLTIPSVMKNYTNRMYVSQLQKTYSQIAEAVQAIMNNDHVDNFKESSAAVDNPSGCPADMSKCTQGPIYFLNNYFKTVKTNCGSAGGGDKTCAKSDSNFYRRLDNAQLTGGIGYYCIQTVTGAAICASFNSNNKCMSLNVDVNGLAQPNIAGRDVFSMDIHENGSISDYGSGCINGNIGNAGSTCGTGDVSSASSAAAGCLNNIIQAGWKMEY